MKKMLLTLCFTLPLLAFHSRLSAQVLDIGHFKSQVYQQTGPALVALRYPDIYFFGNYLDADPFKALSYSLFMVFTPSTTNNEFVMTESGTYHSGYNGPYFSSLTNFDAAYPNGLYDYVTTYSDPNNNTPKSDNVRVQAPANDLFSTTVPAFSSACWSAMQSVDPAADFNLSWNTYAKMPGADYAYTFIGTYDNQTFAYGAFGFSCPPAVGSTTIPAGSLAYGRSYTIQLFFSNRVTPSVTNTDGSSVSVTVGYDDITDAILTTIAPPLKIALVDSEDVTLTWPSLATNYKLQTTSRLDGSGTWTDITDTPDVNGSTNSLTVTIDQSQAFFRLAPLAP